MNERILEALPFDEYRAWPAVSRSTLACVLQKTPAHALYELTHPKPQTDEMILGVATHTLLLEPDSFDAQYALRDLDGRTKLGKAQAEAIEAKGQTPLNKSDWYACLGMAKAVREHPVASILELKPKTELTMLWQDEESGLPCKARLDAVTSGIIWDLKTTKDASPEAFSRTLYSGGYHLQAAFYMRGAAACGLKAQSFNIIAVEREAPYGVAVYRVADEVMQAADRQISKALAIWAECDKTKHYPGYGDGVAELSVPPWAWKSLE